MRKWEEEADANLDQHIVISIQNLAKQYDLNKVILFGSRATKTNWERSDIDLMVSVGDSSVMLEFREALEKLRTLLIFDVVNEKAYNYSVELEHDIMRDGVILYEKV